MASKAGLRLPSLKEFGNLFVKKNFPLTGLNHASNLISMPSTSFMATGAPVWRNFSELIYLLNCYYENPVVQAAVNIKAEAFSNIKFSVKNLSDGEIYSLEDYQKDKGKLHDLLRQPNPLQSTFEWLRQLKINREVFGNGYTYASVPVGWENKFTYQDITVLNNLPPYCMSTILTGQWLDAESKDEIISGYELNQFNGKKKMLSSNSVLHLNNSNIEFDENFTSGKSALLGLRKPISNIDRAFESRNVLITKRGALGILTSDLKDEVTGSLPLDSEQIKEVQDAFAKYGLMNDQYSQIISPLPMKYTKMAMSVKELMLFEEIESSAIAICNSLNVPEKLLPYYKQTGGLQSDTDVHQKRLYDSTIIPESKDFMIGLNNFFNTKELGIELLGTYDHLNVLQNDKKYEAETNSKNVDTAIKAFQMGAVVYNEILRAMQLPEDTEFGEKRIWDLEEAQLSAIGIKKEKTSDDE